MRYILFFSIMSLTMNSFAKVSVLFHPYDNTLAAIGQRIEEAEQTVDIAIYNIDAGMNNPVIKALSSARVQQRLQSGRLKVRLIYEGYEAPAAKQKKMQALEDLGVDVRFLGSSKKMHHKFAVIDGGAPKASLITGSANWSLGSQNNYNENILFFDQEPGVARAYAEEFTLLWGNSKEFGNSRARTENTKINSANLEQGVQPYFNTANFKIKDGRVTANKAIEGYVLTRAMVDAIDQADTHIEIATTRLKLRPIYEAILRAAQRGVKVDIVVTMGEYEYKNKRKRMQVQNCADAYDSNCSSGENYAAFLSGDDFPGHENIDVRLKYFHIKKEAYLSKQMHSKYLLVDRKIVLTGSFNWSYSAEYGHIENVVALDGNVYPEVIEGFAKDFSRLWDNNRNDFSPLVEQVTQALQSSSQMDCGFEPITLEYEEVDYLLATGYRLGKKSVNEVCKTTSGADMGTGEE